MPKTAVEVSKSSLEESPSVQIVEHLAKDRGCSPIELEPTYPQFDLEYLDRLVECMDEDCYIEISINGNRFKVDGNKTVHRL